MPQFLQQRRALQNSSTQGTTSGDALRKYRSMQGGSPPDEPGLLGQIASYFTGGGEEKQTVGGRFRREGPMGGMVLGNSPALRVNERERQVLKGMAKRGAFPKKVAPEPPGAGSEMGVYYSEGSGGGAMPTGSIGMAPIRKGVSSQGENPRANAQDRAGGGVMAEEVAHWLTLRNKEQGRKIARDVAQKHNVNADSLAGLFREVQDPDVAYTERPQEKIAKSGQGTGPGLENAVMALTGVRDSSDINPMHLDLTRRLMKANQTVPKGRREPLLQQIGRLKRGRKAPTMTIN